MRTDDTKVVRGGLLLDPLDATPRLADILIIDDRVEEIGEPGMAAPDDAELVQAERRLLIPGLVNAHTHSHFFLAKGLGREWTLELALHASPWMTGQRGEEELHLGAQLSAIEMVKRGCTTCYDLVLQLPAPSQDGFAAIARAYADIGMRAVVAPMIADGTFWEAIPGLIDALPKPYQVTLRSMMATSANASLEACREILQGWPFDRDQVGPAIAPSIPIHCSDDFLLACRDLARDFGVGLATHVAESAVQANVARKRYGQSLTAHLDELGLLAPNFTAAHAIWLDRDDINRLANNGCTIAHQPGSNLRLGVGVAAVREMLDAGLSVGVGTDAPAYSDHLNMFEAMRLASYLSRITTPDYTRWLSPAEAFRLATMGSAKALGFDDIGRVAEGYKADIVFLDLDEINYVPLNDPLTQLVSSENASAVASVMIGGRMVLEDGALTTVDYPALVTRANETAERLLRETRVKRAALEPLEAIVGAFCVGLAREAYLVDRYLPPLN